MKEQALNSRQTLSDNDATRSPQRFLRPAVDIVETEQALTVRADMPGANKEGLELHMEQGILTLKAQISAPEDKNYLLREFKATSYWRQFQLSDDFDPEQAVAKFSNGVLTLTLAKREAVKPRRIAINYN
ncbi:MAG: Hsp20/alpha crystallin family protein [Desulfuromonas sp.]|nr:Hsp20/alpha crystallin family protein [Desulfuromonas sp.]